LIDPTRNSAGAWRRKSEAHIPDVQSCFHLTGCLDSLNPAAAPDLDHPGGWITSQIAAMKDDVTEVRDEKFPTADDCYTMLSGEKDKFLKHFG